MEMSYAAWTPLVAPATAPANLSDPPPSPSPKPTAPRPTRPLDTFIVSTFVAAAMICLSAIIIVTTMLLTGVRSPAAWVGTGLLFLAPALVMEMLQRRVS